MICFFEQPDPHRLAEAVHKVYGTPPEEIGIIVNDVPEPGTPDHPIVLITHNPITETESTLFEAGGRFAESTGADTELAIASALSKELHTQSLASRKTCK